jgi:hypothetical protein
MQHIQPVITHTEHADDYHKGREAVRAEISEMGWSAALAKFNAENQVGQRYGNLGAYYYAKGGVDALLAAR